MAYLIKSERSFAVVYCDSSYSPVGFEKFVPVIPSFSAVSFIISTNFSISPEETFSATATAASLADVSIIACNRSFIRYFAPTSRLRAEPSVSTESELTVT